MQDDHYLKQELYERVKTDPAIFDFLQSGSLDGIWYWDLENQENEWMSPRFWENFGYNPSDKKHLASEWQDMINKDDLKDCLISFQKHCEDPKNLYDQIVRYTKKDGSTAWVRCRGLAIRDESGKPVRMLGAHTDVTKLKEREAELERVNKELKSVNQLMTGRELQMIELKKEVNSLLNKLGEKPKYNIS